MIRDVAVAVLDKYGAARIMKFLAKRSLRDVLASLMRVESLPFHSVTEFADQCSIFLDPLPARFPELEIADADIPLLHPLRVAASTLMLVPDTEWSRETHRSNLRLLEIPPDDSVEVKKWKRELYHYLRWALLSGKTGPSIPETLEVLGREACVDRIQAANVRSRDIEVHRSSPEPKLEGKVNIDRDKGVDGKRRLSKQWTGYGL